MFVEVQIQDFRVGLGAERPVHPELAAWLSEHLAMLVSGYTNDNEPEGLAQVPIYALFFHPKMALVPTYILLS